MKSAHFRWIVLPGIFLLLFVLPAMAQQNPRMDVPEFRVEKLDGTTFNAKVGSPIRLKIDVGIIEIDLKHLKRFTFHPEGETGSDSAELDDSTHPHGELETPTITLLTEAGREEVPVRSLRELKQIEKKSVSLLSVLIGLFTLAAMEIVLGIDNVIFLAIVVGKLPEEQQRKARNIGLILALLSRLCLLATLSFLLGLTKPVVTLPAGLPFTVLEAREISTRDLILLIGGAFLIGKSVREMHEKLESGGEEATQKKKTTSFLWVLIEIATIDIIFSLDSVITAVGMVEEIWVMVTAMIIAMFVMMVFSGSISRFVERHPTVKVLALAFLILIGVMLLAEAMGQHIDKGYIYFAMAFAVTIEMINLQLQKKKVGHG